jgi:hypothetical protein
MIPFGRTRLINTDCIYPKGDVLILGACEAKNFPEIGSNVECGVVDENPVLTVWRAPNVGEAYVARIDCCVINLALHCTFCMFWQDLQYSYGNLTVIKWLMFKCRA